VKLYSNQRPWAPTACAQVPMQSHVAHPDLVGALAVRGTRLLNSAPQLETVRLLESVQLQGTRVQVVGITGSTAKSTVTAKSTSTAKSTGMAKSQANAGGNASGVPPRGRPV
jgi:UDP-N-acetylmuramyl pentapeptide synthase